MFKDELLKELEGLQSRNEVAAVATVVRRDAPTSGKPGDKAIITEDGQVKGWIGGGCTKGIVIKEALSSIKEQSPRLVKIQTALDTPDQPGVKNYKMTCQSGGSVEVYIEPIMPVTHIRIFGRSHIGRALCEIGRTSGFSISVISDAADSDMFPSANEIIKLSEYTPSVTPFDFAVVCTQGEQDVEGMEAAIKTGSRYIGFVASRKKASSVLLSLKRQGVPHEELVKVKTPAGFDLNAKTPEEVAISILAEIIREKRSKAESAEKQEPDTEERELTDDLYINPVCKIPVQKSTAKHVLDYEGEKVYFCCDGCKESFEKEPATYMS
ncbi:MAG: XdhC family protein [Cyclobacteriaceae bacterium]